MARGRRLTKPRGAGETAGQKPEQTPMISHPHECIFVHVPKTGGQSVEAVFQAALGLEGRVSSTPKRCW